MKHKILIGLLFVAGVLGVALLPGCAVAEESTEDIPGLFDIARDCAEKTSAEMVPGWVDSVAAEVDSLEFFRVDVRHLQEWLTDGQIRHLASSGRICEVFGHWWEYGGAYIGTFTYSETGLVEPMPPGRACCLCGQHEIRAETWEEVR